MPLYRLVHILSIFSFIWLLIAAADVDIESQRRHHVSTTVNVLHPKQLAKTVVRDSDDKEEGYEHTDALFGVPFLKNRSIAGSVFYRTARLKDGSGCSTYDDVMSIEDRAKPTKIFLIDRGTCSFAQKTGYAQNQGADALVIANSECLKSDFGELKSFGYTDAEIISICCGSSVARMSPTGMCSKTSLKIEEMKTAAYEYLPFMVSSVLPSESTDSVGMNINIPAVMIRLSDALKIKSCICKVRKAEGVLPACKELEGKFTDGDVCKLDVKMELKLDTPHKDKKVSYELWMKPEVQPEFLQDFMWFSMNLKHTTNFVPRYIVHESLTCEESNSEICKQFCKELPSKKMLCYLPEGDNLDLTGASILDEAVRQYCVWEQANEKWEKNGGEFWWSYQLKFAQEKCIRDADSGKTLSECSAKITKELKDFDSKKFSACVAKDASILQALSDQQEEAGVFTTSMIVNSRVIHFSLAADTVAERICDGFSEGNLPHVCACVLQVTNENDFQLCSKCSNKEECEKIYSKEQKYVDADSTSSGSNGGGASKSALVLVVIFVLGVSAGAILYVRDTKKRMTDDFKSLLAEYMPLDEAEGTGHFERMLGGEGNVGSSSNREDANLI